MKHSPKKIVNSKGFLAIDFVIGWSIFIIICSTSSLLISKLTRSLETLQSHYTKLYETLNLFETHRQFPQRYLFNSKYSLTTTKSLITPTIALEFTYLTPAKQ